jgi:hypothetical protein
MGLTFSQQNIGYLGAFFGIQPTFNSYTKGLTQVANAVCLPEDKIYKH